MTNLPVLSRRDARFLVATVHYEAAGEPRLGQAAVAQVILNRAKDGRRGWVGPGVGPVERVCMARKQFSCWNGRKNRNRKLAALFVDGNPDRGWINDTVARGSRDTVRAFLNGQIDTRDVLLCSHYLNPTTAPQVGSALSSWARRWREGYVIARHVFLRPDQLTPPEQALELQTIGPRFVVDETVNAAPPKQGRLSTALNSLRQKLKSRLGKARKEP